MTVRHAFLIYANRSGSTFLSTQLSKRIAPEHLVVVPEFRLLEYLFHVGDRGAKALDPSEMALMVEHDHQVEGNLRVPREELIPILQSTSGEGIDVKLHKILQAYISRNLQPVVPEVVLWKWGNAATYIEEIGEVFPGARFVHVVRDGRGVVNSLLRSESPYFPGEDLARGSALHGVHHWTSSIRRNKRPRRAGLPLLEVRFNHLVRSPEAVLRSVGGFLDVAVRPAATPEGQTFKVSAPESGIHRLVNESPRSDRVDGWQTELSDWRRHIVEHAARRELEALGYPLPTTGVPLVKHVEWLARGQVERAVGMCRWATRRLRRYGARQILRLVGLRIRAWTAGRSNQAGLPLSAFEPAEF